MPGAIFLQPRKPPDIWQASMHHNCSGFALPPGVSFCVTDNRAIFLDQTSDRYLALSTEQDRALGSLLSSSKSEAGERERLNKLVEQGLLIPTAITHPPEPCRHRLPARAVTASSSAAVPALAQLRFAWQVNVARRRLKRAGLYETLQALQQFRMARRFTPHHLGAALQEAAGLLGVIGRYMTRLDQCLPISLGLAYYLLQRGVECDLVLGVQLGPFRAHCWVQHGDQLVGDDLDIVRTFTPIVVA